ncbi:MAG: hypothetical protein Q7S26_01000 [bacterium]|nr:hypothetical protein [bacterium]
MYILSANKTENRSTGTAQQTTILPNATNTSQNGTLNQQNPSPQNTGPATATINPYSLQTNPASPTISGVYNNTFNIEVVIAKTQLPKMSFLNDPILGVMWDDVSDHGGGVSLSGTNSGIFSDHVTNVLPEGTYYVGVYLDVLFYPRTDANAAKEYRQLLDSAVLTVQRSQ